jgi:hypothetical protein
MEDKLLTLKELRIALVGPECPFGVPPAASTIRLWTSAGMETFVLPDGKRKHYKVSTTLEFLRKRGVIK